MKIYNQITKSGVVAITSALLILGGCRKDLDYTPEVFLSAEQVYKDQPGAIAGVTGIYKQLQSLKC
jgi:hypothetical protein